MVEQRPFKPKVVGSIPTAPTKNPDDSVALALLNVPNRTIKWGVLVPSWSQLNRLHPSDETVFDGHTCSSLSFFPSPEGAGDLGEGATSPPPPKICRMCSSWSEKH